MTAAAVFVLSTGLFAQEVLRPTSIIDTPTAFTLGRGMYQMSFMAYDGGGMEFKSSIGIHDAIYFGLSFDVEHAIGKEDAEPNTPGVVAKIKFTDGWDTFPISIALGYDSFYIGSLGRIEDAGSSDRYNGDKLNHMLYGPYLAVTKPLYIAGGEQYFSFGIRVPAYPSYVPEDTAYFVSLDIPLGTMFAVKAEGERIYWNLKHSEDWLFNAGLRLNFMPNAGIDFCVIFQHDQKPNRIIRVEYSDAF
jgi:hypothetical protein